MEHPIAGLHHVTAIAGNARRNLDFYSRVLGLRLVKKTVNFDDPGTYHFYFGDEKGSPGTILTFFPWEGIRRGVTGTGMVSSVNYAVSPASVDFWKKRLAGAGVQVTEGEKYGERQLQFQDPDGLAINLVGQVDPRQGWQTSGVPEEVALKGFHGVTLLLQRPDVTARILTGVFGYRLERSEGNQFRYRVPAIDTASVVDLEEMSAGTRGVQGAGTFHHVAFRVKNEEELMEYRQKVLDAGLQPTGKIDRDYFFSVYFREPGGVLFELATDNPGFTRDEPLEELGRHLKLPRQYEAARQHIESVLPALS